MYLLADIGNYRVKWAVADSHDSVGLSFTTRTGAGLSSTRKAFARCRDLGPISAVIIASVVPDAAACLRNVSAECLPGIPVCNLDYKAFSDIMPIRVKPVVIPPGADRLANAYALAVLHRLPACAVDAGSAITLEVVNAAGAFIGGSISPGEHLQLASLQLKTSRLGEITSLPGRTPAIGTHTAEAIASGIGRGSAWAVYGLLQDMQQELGCSFETVVVTGGNGRRLASFLAKKIPAVVFDKNLTVRGMLSAYHALTQSGTE